MNERKSLTKLAKYPDVVDWTVNPKSGRSNDSPLFKSLVDEVADLLRSESSMLMSDPTKESTARLIVAQLAHEHGLVPSQCAQRKKA